MRFSFAGRVRTLVHLAAVAVMVAAGAVFGADQEQAMDPLVRAPDFPKQFAWLNTDQPLSFSGNLKGQVVVLDFWTYACINCMHVLPDLEYLEQKFKDQPVVIIGVHSAKYDNEGDVANIRAAIQRYGVHHPVIVDEKHAIWDSYDVRSWPTLILVGSDGKIIGGASGEGHRELFENRITKALEDGKKAGTLAKTPLKLKHEGEIRSASGLAFPGKVVADKVGGRLFVVDSNHNRIVVTSYPSADGRVKVQAIIGAGTVGSADGDFATAQFHRPQGAVLGGGGNVLWVADTENHLVRRVDLEKKAVLTVLGTGKQTFDPEAGKTGREQGLNSPWDVAVAGNRLYISQAGQHQLFAMNLMTGMTEVAAGSGRENIRDGAAGDANLAQPSALAMDAANNILYFADSEVSAIRGFDIKADEIFTVVGHGLFDFGDVDGDAEQARLQHAIGVALAGDGKSLLVADTYNHKIRRVTLGGGEKTQVTTVAGDGKAGTSHDGKVAFFEPAGITVGAPGEAFVADTNNHRIVEMNPETNAWKDLVIDGLTAPGAEEVMIAQNAIDAGKADLADGKEAAIWFDVKLPAGSHLTAGAPVSVKVTDGKKVIYSGSVMSDGKLPLKAAIPAGALAEKPGELWVTLYYTHCMDGINAVCTPEEAAWKVNVHYEGSGSAIRLTQ